MAGREICVTIPRWMERSIKELIEEEREDRANSGRPPPPETVESWAWYLIVFGIDATRARGKKTAMNPICPSHWANSVNAIRRYVDWYIKQLRLAALGKQIEPETLFNMAECFSRLAMMVRWTLPDGFWPMADGKDDSEVIEAEFGNVFVPTQEPDAWQKNLNVLLARALRRAVQERGLTVESSAALLKITESEMRDICHLSTGDMTPLYLLGLLNSLCVL